MSRLLICTLFAVLNLSVVFAQEETREKKKEISAAGKSASGESGANRSAPKNRRISEPINAAALDSELLEELVVTETNRERKAGGLNPLKPSTRLAGAARTHSADMAKRGYFSHDTKKLLKDGSFAARIRTDDYSPRGLAENIAMQPIVYRRTTKTDNRSDRSRSVVSDESHSYESMAREVVKQWMESPGHRRNIMDSAYTSIGIGCAVGDRRGIPYIYITQDFAAESRE
jgi:uncharacterized protein YkwD